MYCRKDIYSVEVGTCTWKYKIFSNLIPAYVSNIIVHKDNLDIILRFIAYLSYYIRVIEKQKKDGSS